MTAIEVPQQRRFVRSKSDRMIAGVCGGLGAHFNTDPVLFRIGFVVAALMGGTGLLLYILAVMFVPRAGEPAGPSATWGRVFQAVGIVTGMATLLMSLGYLFLGGGSTSSATFTGTVAVGPEGQVIQGPQTQTVTSTSGLELFPLILLGVALLASVLLIAMGRRLRRIEPLAP